MKKEDWEKKNIKSNWVGFNYIDQLLESIENKNETNKCDDTIDIKSNNHSILLCLLYQIHMKKNQLQSVIQFNDLK
jgi:hypothetical protein